MSVTFKTNLGDIKAEVFCDIAPKTCENFLKLAASGQYNGTNFHRNIAGFMVQGGDPTKTGKGGECIWGGKFNDEVTRESKNLLHDKKGILSMANNGPNTNGAQFFFTYGPQPHLDGKYVIFGQIIGGFDVLEKMEKVPVSGKKNKPVNDILIDNILIHANPLA
jgi:peptidyl-prolyl cis-trans isomerase-like 3